MNKKIEYTSAQLAAYNNVRCFIRESNCLPDQVFSGQWHEFRFCIADHIVTPMFATVATEFLKAESAQSCCLLNFDRKQEDDLRSESVSFLDAHTTEADYYTELVREDDREAWLYSMERYGCSSDVGEWCIYCERINEIAIIGLRYPDGIDKFYSALERLAGLPIGRMLQMGSSAIMPFNRLVDRWRCLLTSNYSDRQP